MLQKTFSITFILGTLLFANTLFAAKPTPDYIKYYNEGTVAQKNGDYSAAIELYKEALDSKPDFSDAWNNLGYCYRMVAKTYLVQAGAAYEQALEHDHFHEEALEYQGEYFLMIGELKKSYANYKTLKELKSGEARELIESIDPLLKQARDILRSYSP